MNGEIPDVLVSVIVPFRNESENILTCLSSVACQDLSKDKYEVIFVNDFSDDDSLEKITGAGKPANIKVLSIPGSYPVNRFKKRAVRYGIENASGDIIVTTDADCVHNPKWLSTILKCFDEDTGFVSGPVAFTEGRTLFDKFQMLEFTGLVLTGAGLIGINQPAICNAANIAYRKKVFIQVNGFDTKTELSSGDDELLMQKIGKETNFKIKFCMNKDAVVTTQPNRTINQFFGQRKRWASKGLFYANKMLVLKLILIFLFYLSLPVQLTLCIIFPKMFSAVFILSLALKFIFEYKIIKKGKGFLFEGRLLNFFPLAEFIQIPYIIIAGISGVFGNFAWKGRKVKR